MGFLQLHFVMQMQVHIGLLVKAAPGLHIVTVWNNTPPLRQIGCDYNMPENKLYPPEGLRPPSSFTLQSLREAMEQNTVLEDRVLRCDAGHNLLLSLGGIQPAFPGRRSSPPGSAVPSGTSPSSPGWESPPVFS